MSPYIPPPERPEIPEPPEFPADPDTPEDRPCLDIPGVQWVPEVLGVPENLEVPSPLEPRSSPAVPEVRSDQSRRQRPVNPAPRSLPEPQPLPEHLEVPYSPELRSLPETPERPAPQQRSNSSRPWFRSHAQPLRRSPTSFRNTTCIGPPSTPTDRNSTWRECACLRHKPAQLESQNSSIRSQWTENCSKCPCSRPLALPALPSPPAPPVIRLLLQHPETPAAQWVPAHPPHLAAPADPPAL